MPKQYCSNCGTAALPTMRMCPACGNKTFLPSPPAQTNATPGVTTASSMAAQAVGVPPSSIGAPVASMEPAGNGARFVAYLIDYAIITLAAAILGGLAGAVGVGSTHATGSMSGGVLLLAGVAVPFVYFTVMHARERGATVGKAAMKLRLISVTGERLTHTQAFVRCLLTLLIPVAGWLLVGITAAGTMSSDVQGVQSVGLSALGIGVIAISVGPYMTVFFNPQHQTLFDMICKTCVIKNR
jgi:uncharacterized RDD family membrane protein YckC